MLIDISEHIEKEIKAYNNSLRLRISADISMFYPPGTAEHKQFLGVAGVVLLGEFDDDPVLAVPILDLLSKEVDIKFIDDDIETKGEIMNYLLNGLKKALC